MSKYGLVNDEMRRKIWPLLLNLDLLVQEEDSQLTVDKLNTTQSSISTSLFDTWTPK